MRPFSVWQNIPGRVLHQTIVLQKQSDRTLVADKRRRLSQGFYMDDRVKGLLITTIGVLLVVPDSLFVRLIDGDPIATAFWRAMTAGIFVLIALLTVQGTRGFRAVAKSGKPALLYTLMIGSTAPAFVLAVANTSVANVVFIFASMPIFAAAFSRIFLGEPIQLRMVLTMIVVIFGLGVIAYGSSESQIASWKGDIWAVYVSVAFAAALTAARKAKNTSMIPAIPIAYICAALVLGIFSNPLELLPTHWPLILSHGAFIGAASCLLSLGPRYISSAEVSLLVLLESVLAPILVWIAIGENPGNWAVIGGVIVIGALVLSNAYALVKKGTS